ncbi:YqgE/AlgH family protein [Sulfitobacter sp. BDSS02]|uniref:YqgE/AlgH family protein n=1 Tax=Heliomarina TaxID=2917553 RepID=UPI001EE298BA|nr:YqgE/AlgH family protein [Heliomarina baculiformis]MBL3701533.1 YqgE/AlgH family protein [Sulfitobacter sp. BDSS02]MBR9847810.1 YqgE/AlgH family protein [Paracoccaceae bacterium]
MDLTGKLLIAMPGMGDLRFERSVILMCSHDDDGAMGLIINKPAEDVHLSDLLAQLEIEGRKDAAGRDLPVHFGGPVEGARGFLLHSNDYESPLQTLRISDTLRMTATLDILEDIASGTGPSKFLMVLGYAGWGPGQLEQEIAHNGWLTAEVNEQIIYDLDNDAKWGAALAEIGVDPLTLSASSGNA